MALIGAACTSIDDNSLDGDALDRGSLSETTDDAATGVGDEAETRADASIDRGQISMADRLASPPVAETVTVPLVVDAESGPTRCHVPAGPEVVVATVAPLTRTEKLWLSLSSNTQR